MRLTQQLPLALAASCLVIAGGCPSSAPVSPKPATPEVTERPGEKPAEATADNADAAKALEANGAILAKDKAGHIIEVELSRDNGKDDDLKHLAGLPSVRSLSAECRGVTDAGLAHLKGHPNLRSIKLERSSVTNEGMVHLKEIPKMEDVDLKRTDITAEGYAHLGQIASLKRLRATYTPFDDKCCAEIEDLKNLELLDLQDCKLVTEKGLAVLAGFPKLRSLRLYGRPGINDNVLSHVANLKELTSLSLEQSDVTAAGLGKLKELPKLKELALYGAISVNDAAVETLQGHKLEKLDLRQTLLTSLALSHLKDMKTLKLLDVSETANVGNEGLEHIRNLTGLEDLNLLSAQIDDAGLVNLAGMKKLQRLNLDKCYITDVGLQHLAPLEALEFLSLSETKITDAGLEHLKGLKNLKTLVVTYVEGVSGDGVDKLQESLPNLADVQR